MCSCNSTSSSNVSTRRAVGECPELYEVLRGLDLRVLNLLTVEPSDILLDTNRQLRFWMRNLRSYCPTEEDVSTVESFIETEEVRVKN